MKLIPEKKQKKMKKFSKVLLPAMACIVLLYSSCRKSENTPAPAAGTNTSTAVTSKAIALNIIQSISGFKGGVNLMGGVDSVNIRGARRLCGCVNTSPLCGFFTDSLVDISSTEGDTSSHAGGNLTFYFNCQNGQKAGYTAYDSLGFSRSTPKGWAQNYYVKQAYTIQSLDSKHQFIGVSGDNYFYQTMNLFCGCNNTPYVDIENSNYVLNNLTIDVCKKDILSGTATFKAYGEGWNLSGTLTFLGNHLVDVNINGQVTRVNISQYCW